jgi:hypothetical protein
MFRCLVRGPVPEVFDSRARGVILFRDLQASVPSHVPGIVLRRLAGLKGAPWTVSLRNTAR